ncbi:MAG: hypothetical protein EBR27_08465 [Betaproteobacteria bacterium]|nr:hypothetical protein [Betaproteobacteria bacterium]
MTRLQVVSINNPDKSKRRLACVKKQTSIEPVQALIEGLARHGVMQIWPSKPEVMLRNDDLLNIQCNDIHFERLPVSHRIGATPLRESIETQAVTTLQAIRASQKRRYH